MKGIALLHLKLFLLKLVKIGCGLKHSAILFAQLNQLFNALQVNLLGTLNLVRASAQHRNALVHYQIGMLHHVHANVSNPSFNLQAQINGIPQLVLTHAWLSNVLVQLQLGIQSPALVCAISQALRHPASSVGMRHLVHTNV